MTAQLEALPLVASAEWAPVCSLTDLIPERGAAALVGGRQVAVFLLADGRVYAVDNHDPFSRANVMSRGIVGTRGEVATVASPMFKQVFDLASGQCLDDADVALSTYRARVCGKTVEVAVGSP